MTLRRSNSDKYELCSERALCGNRFKSDSCQILRITIVGNFRRRFKSRSKIIQRFKRKTKQ